MSLEYNRKTEPGSADYMGNYNFGHDANNPLNTGNGYANMLLGVFTHLHRADQPRRQRRAPLAERLLPAGQLARRRRVSRSTTASACSTAGPTSKSTTITPASSPTCGSAARRRACIGWPAPRACLATRPAPPATSARSTRPTRRVPPDRVHRQHRPGLRQADQRHHHRRHGRARSRDLFQVPVLHLRRRASGIAWNVTGDGKTAIRSVVGNLLQLPAFDRRLAGIRSPAAARSRARSRSAGRRSTTSPRRHRRPT